MKIGCREQFGFTLVELLVSLSIFSVIAVAVYSAFAGGVGAWKRTQEFSSVYQTARLLLDDMARQLKNAVKVSGTEFTGTPRNLSFITSRQRPYPMGGPTHPQIIKVTYEVRRDTASSGLALYRSMTSDVKNFQKDRGKSELMVGSISALDFEYTYQNGEGKLQPWNGFWKEDHEIPLGVKITLLIGGTRFTKMVLIPHGFREEGTDQQKS